MTGEGPGIAAQVAAVNARILVGRSVSLTPACPVISSSSNIHFVLQ
jgi:hypothetical protein